MNNINKPLYSKKVSLKSIIVEKTIKYFFMLNGLVTLFIILLIFFFLLNEAMQGLNSIPFSEFFFHKQQNGGNKLVFQWYPTSQEPRYSLIPLILGSLLTAIPATIISSIFGIAIGIYLSEIANHKLREILKPFIELFSSIPTVVLGFILLAAGASFLGDIFHPASRLNAFLASIGLSLIVIPIIATLTEDALRSIPNDIRLASYSLGATKWQTITKIILPAAINGASASIILGFGRAIGETMIVLMTTGNAGEITFNIFRSVRTMTATMAAETGEVSQYSTHYYALFFIGFSLFVITFVLNLIAELIINRMKLKFSKYER